MTHQLVSPEEGRRIVASALSNGDTVPDVLAIAAMTAIETGVPFHTLTATLIAEQAGNVVDAEGNLR